MAGDIAEGVVDDEGVARLQHVLGSARDVEVFCRDECAVRLGFAVVDSARVGQAAEGFWLLHQGHSYGVRFFAFALRFGFGFGQRCVLARRFRL